MNDQKPYLTRTQIVTSRIYNEYYGDQRECVCRHPYERHFDSYMEMEPIGCKYCACDDFIENVKTAPSIVEEPDYFPVCSSPSGPSWWDWESWNNYIRSEIGKCNAYWRDLIESYKEEFKQH